MATNRNRKKPRNQELPPASTLAEKDPATNRLRELYGSLQRQLMADLEGARSANKNAEAKGGASEETWLGLLERHLPHRYRAVKGIVVDCNGDESHAIDIIIHDRQYTPLIYNMRGNPYVPAESVYAVIEAKQQFDKGLIEYAGEKVESVRKLHRTSATIPFAAGSYEAKPPFSILGGIVAYGSDWTPPFGDAFRRVISELPSTRQLDIGICAIHGCFEASYPMGKAEIEVYPAEHALAAFLIRLLARLQALGTVPAIDYNVYGRLLRP
ncbi:MAG: DUF6602 domain-containing protein [Pseudomonas sp.]